jgi:AAA domain
MPVPILIDTESGSHQYDCHRITVSNYQELEAAIETLLKERNDYKTVVIDTIDWAEKYMIAKICKTKNVDSLGGFAHGRGYTLLRDSFDKFLFRLMAFMAIGKHVVLIGHAQVKGVQLPGLEQFDRYELKLDRCNSDSATEWVDFQLFLNWETRTIETKEGHIKATGGKDRFLYPVHSIGYDAKNHCGLTKPLECSYTAIAQLFESAPPPPAVPIQKGPARCSLRNSSRLDH